MDEHAVKKIEDMAKAIRRDIVEMIGEAKSGHPGGSLSAVEIVTYLYFTEMNIDPLEADWKERDRFVLSKGHAAPLLYAVLAHRGYFPRTKCPRIPSSSITVSSGFTVALKRKTHGRPSLKYCSISSKVK